MKKRRNTVVVLGGGVAGMSAAHELAERGFTVSVYEWRRIPGGKARSVPVGPPGPGGQRHSIGDDLGFVERTHLPGEHGFRFFPAFYRHVTDTMTRIPFAGNRHGVYDNLVGTRRVEICQAGQPRLVTLANCPRSLDDLRVLLRALRQFSTAMGLQPGEVEFYLTRIWQIATSCGDRRLDEYERVGWWDYIGANDHSPQYGRLLAAGLSRSLVAAQPKLANTRTGGTILLQLLLNMFQPFVSTDRVLNGPTNPVWIDPWLRHLRDTLGVAYHFGAKVLAIESNGGEVTGARIQHVHEEGKPVEMVRGDYYVAALPVEAMAYLLHDEHGVTNPLLEADSTLSGIRTLAENTAWMNGIQFYLKEDVPLEPGHQLYIDSPWALTSLSQRQFWRDGLKSDGNGTVKGILSVDVSDWDACGELVRKRAIDCTPAEIQAEVWHELKERLNVGGATPLKDANLAGWYLDDDIRAREYVAEYAPVRRDAQRRPTLLDPHSINLEPLLVNRINTWHLRPDAYTRIPNLFLAADYVRTYTDLATMEGANEAARRATNAILDASGSTASDCPFWELHEPWVLAWWRWLDQGRYGRGVPWRAEVPGAQLLGRFAGAARLAGAALRRLVGAARN